MVQSPQIKLNLLGCFMLETKHKKSHSLQVTGTNTNLLKTKKCKLMYMNQQLLKINSRLMQVHSQNCTKEQNKLKWLIERRMVDKETEAESCELRYLNDDFKTRVSSFNLVPPTQNPSPHEDPAWCSCKVLLVTTGPASQETPASIKLCRQKWPDKSPYQWCFWETLELHLD